MALNSKPKVYGTGLIALDLVLGADPESPVRAWTGGTCGNVLSILAYLGWAAYPIARMNGDAASDRVRTDMSRWGVNLDFISCGPTTHTPIVIQEIRRGRDGRPKHRFSWSCPQCGKWLPSFRAITIEAVETVAPALTGASVFFLDRVSRATLSLAARAAEAGALVVFEPSGRATDGLFAEALQIAHVVKYADQRLAGIDEAIGHHSQILAEIQTLGGKGLRYRHRLGRGRSGWLHLDAVAAPKLVDSCGSGDWCTAGLISKLAHSGVDGVRATGSTGLRAALRYGQAVAAWNCAFEGARGGMYAFGRETFDLHVSALLAGQRDAFSEPPTNLEPVSLIDCPSCPSRSRPGKSGLALARSKRVPRKTTFGLSVVRHS